MDCVLFGWHTFAEHWRKDAPSLGFVQYHWPQWPRLFQQREGGCQDAPLLFVVARVTKDKAARQPCDHRPWWVDQPDTAPIPRHHHRCNPFHLQRSRNQSHGLMTDWSYRSQQRSVDGHFPGQ